MTPRAVFLALFVAACGSDDSEEPAGTGGTTGSGGSVATGGSPATGGAVATGGWVASGGTQADASAGGTGGGSTGGAPGQDAGAAGRGGSGACSSTGLEPNGVKQIYPTACGKAKPWVLGFDDWKKRVHQFPAENGTGAATTVKASGQVRLTVKAEESACEGITDQGKALSQGYMCSANDWKNYELTAYLKLDVAAPASTEWDFTLYGNGGRHTGSGPPTGCMGSSYKGSYDYKQKRARFGKESWHVNYDWRAWKTVPNGIDMTASPSAWLGMKVVRYEFSRSGQKGVRHELYLDTAGIDASGAPKNAWALTLVEEDHPSAGSWGSAAKQCGVPADDQIMLWAGPWLTFRWDDTTATARLLSAREIVPPANPPPP